MGSMRPDAGPPDRRPWLLCDWGGTVMEDRPGSTGPMTQWTHLIALEGCRETLALLTQYYRFALATNAAESDEAEIRLALKEVRLNAFFEHVFCARTLGVRKPDRAFFDFIGATLKRPAGELTMLGDDFEVDVQGANDAGFYAVWLNRLDGRRRLGERHTTILDWRELPAALLAQQI